MTLSRIPVFLPVIKYVLLGLSARDIIKQISPARPPSRGVHHHSHRHAAASTRHRPDSRADCVPNTFQPAAILVLAGGTILPAPASTRISAG